MNLFEAASDVARSKGERGGDAFPGRWGDGMSLRDYFAGQALISFGRITAAEIHTHGGPDQIAGAAYLLADAMLEARKRP